MASPTMSDIRAATEVIVKDARTQNRLSSLTPRMIRQGVEQALKLDAGTLDTKDYKAAVKDATDAALANENHSDAEAPIEGTLKSGAKSKKRKSNDMETEPAVKTVKKPKTKSVKKPKLSAVETPEHEKGQGRSDSGSKKLYKSAAIIASSDEDEEAGTVSASIPQPKVPPQRPRKTKMTHGIETPISESKAKSKRDSSNAAAKSGASILERPSEPKSDKSESEMSVLIDATPIGPKKKDKAPAKTKKAKKTKKSAVELSKDEETIKRLKSFVHACGVRKVWTKEFQNFDGPSQQIKRLKEILAGLGMDGRLSMEKAKAIKEKRDLAKELEDVRSFEQAIVGQPSAKPKRGTHSAASEGESGSDFANDPPTKHKNAARRSIMAFLEDDEDE